MENIEKKKLLNEQWVRLSDPIGYWKILFDNLKKGYSFAPLSTKDTVTNTERYQSGQMGRTVNPLRKLRRFESFSPHIVLSSLV